jgi:hypothetical protein
MSETESVYFAVRTESLNVIQVNFRLLVAEKRKMAVRHMKVWELCVLRVSVLMPGCRERREVGFRGLNWTASAWRCTVSPLLAVRSSPWRCLTQRVSSNFHVETVCMISWWSVTSITSAVSVFWARSRLVAKSAYERCHVHSVCPHVSARLPPVGLLVNFYIGDLWKSEKFPIW